MPSDVRRGLGAGSFLLVFGEGSERWSAIDPGDPRVMEADHRIRYGQPTRSDMLLIADALSTFRYLVHVCPTTRLAIEKLRAIRNAVEALPAEARCEDGGGA